MNKTKISLADLLTFLSALGFGFFCYLSINFLTLGETNNSIIGAVIIALILGGIALGAKLIKSTSHNFKTYIVFEWVFLIVFSIVAYIALFPFSHYFSVSERKTEIQQKITSNIIQAEGLFPAYEKYANNRLSAYQSRLNTVVTGKIVDINLYKSCGFMEGGDDRKQIINKLSVLKSQLFPSNYKKSKIINLAWLSTSNATINNWVPIGVVNVIETIKTEVFSWKNEFVGYSKFRGKGEVALNFDDKLYDYKLNLNDVAPIMLKTNNPNILSIAFALALYALMLLPYFIAKRHSKSNCSLFSFLKREKNESKDNGIDIKY